VSASAAFSTPILTGSTLPAAAVGGVAGGAIGGAVGAGVACN